jgi:hypothetical protein
VTAQTAGTPTPSLTVSPTDALAPAPRNEGLNSNYDYIGKRSAYQPHNQLWCHEQGTGYSCGSHRTDELARATVIRSASG